MQKNFSFYDPISQRWIQAFIVYNTHPYPMIRLKDPQDQYYKQEGLSPKRPFYMDIKHLEAQERIWWE